MSARAGTGAVVVKLTTATVAPKAKAADAARVLIKGNRDMDVLFENSGLYLRRRRIALMTAVGASSSRGGNRLHARVERVASGQRGPART